MDFLLKREVSGIQDMQMEMWKIFPFGQTLTTWSLSIVFEATTAGNLEVEAICESAERNIQTELKVEESNRERLGKPTNPVPLEQLANLTSGLSVNYQNAEN